MARITAIVVLLFSISSFAFAAEKVILLYDGVAPGSESWHQQEEELFSDWLGEQGFLEE